ncbi:MAG: small ribosomal subunit Rsm22 family protein [Bacteriovoracia bacterium]
MKSSLKSRPRPGLRFDPKLEAEWRWYFDEQAPNFVRQTFSPPKRIKQSRPFGEPDAAFFFSGIAELSDFFTVDRAGGRERGRVPNYFSHPRFRSSYLLYLFPLQAAKFLHLCQLHFPKLPERKRIRVLDVGAGPGTASIAFLMHLFDLARAEGKDIAPPDVEMLWVDTNLEIMRDGQTLMQNWLRERPGKNPAVTLQLQREDWSRLQPKGFDYIFLGNVLNELHHRADETRALLARMMSANPGAHFLFVEPADKGSSQLLAKVRDGLVMKGTDPTGPDSSGGAPPAKLIGPCLHAEKCPLTDGRDWCHFSVPAEIPGKWFLNFSKRLGSARTWIKFSYLCLVEKSGATPAPAPGNARLVLTDPLRGKDGKTQILLCEPERPHRWAVPPKSGIHRGDIVESGAFTPLKTVADTKRDRR